MEEWISELTGVQPSSTAMLVIYAVIVVLLILLLVWLRRGSAGGNRARGRNAPEPRLSLSEVLAVDNNRRLLLVRCDRHEHLVMIGGPNDLVIDGRIGHLPAVGRAEPGEGRFARQAPTYYSGRTETVEEPAATRTASDKRPEGSPPLHIKPER